MDGNSSAAEHVALRISRHPKRWEREIIRLRSRFEGTPLKDIRQQALVQGVLLALSWDQEAEAPIQIGPSSTWFYDQEQNLATIMPIDFPVHLFWDWVKEESARAAESSRIARRFWKRSGSQSPW